MIDSKEFASYFKFSDTTFSGPVEFTDAIGFSITKNYPNKHYASIYSISLLPNSKTRWVIAIRVDYGEKLGEGIRLTSDKQSVWSPVNLNSLDEYFYDTTTHKFYHQNKEIFANQIFANIDKAHMQPTKCFSGFYLRCRLWLWHKAFPFIIKLIDKILIAFLYIISGERLKRDIWERLISRYNKKTEGSIPEIQFDKGKTINFFGYDAKRWSVVFYCALHFIFYLVIYYANYKFLFLHKIFANNFLILCYVVISFAITESLVPQILKKIIIKVTPSVLEHIADKKLRL